MSFDGIYLRALIAEWNEAIIGARVNRVDQHGKHVLVLELFHGRRTQLLFSLHPTMLAACAGQVKLERERTPTPFCMLLRKHLEGARLIGIEQSGCDRAARLSFTRPNELGDKRNVALAVEWLGSRTNLMLLDEGSRILGHMLPLPEPSVGIESFAEELTDRSSQRWLVVGALYEPPSLSRGQVSLLDWTADHPTSDSFSPEPDDMDLPVWRWLLRKVSGPGPLLCRDLAVRSGIDPNMAVGSCSAKQRQQLRDQLDGLARATRKGAFQITYVPENGRYAAFPLVSIPAEKQQTKRSANELLLQLFQQKWQERHIQAARQRLKHVTQQQIDLLTRKLSARRAEWASSEDAERWRLYGELLTAHLHLIHHGDSVAEVLNYYDESMAPLSIPLDSRLSPAENAQKYFQRYRKALRRREVLQKLIDENTVDLQYMNHVMHAVESAESLADLEEIERELRQQGVLPDKARHESRKKRKDEVESVQQPRRFDLSSDWTAFVGRNNVQNDALTMRWAQKNDLWLHVKEIPGSHVILRNRKQGGQPFVLPPEEILHSAAALAAYYSKARHSTNVPVDYTWRKHVRKPRHARPGMVVYDHHQTIFVHPRLPEEYVPQDDGSFMS